MSGKDRLASGRWLARNRAITGLNAAGLGAGLLTN